MMAVLACGGTGGHVCPALAVGQALAARGVEVRLAVTSRAVESKLLASSGFGPPIVVRASGFRVKGLSRKALALLHTAPATLAAAGRLRRVRADVVLGLGGYASVPVVAGALLAGIPRAIHEPNVQPGLANALLARVSDLVFAVDESTFAMRNGTVRVTGVPVRGEVLSATREEGARHLGIDPARPTVLVTTGSLGAAAMNEIAAGALTELVRDGVQAVHVTGEADYERIRSFYARFGAEVVCMPLTERMDLALAACDLVVCRAGASTLAEVCARGLPAVVVPSPNVAGDHQRANAARMANAGAAVCLDEAGLDSDGLLQTIRGILGGSRMRRAMASASASLGRPDAAEEIAEALVSLAGRRKG